MNKKGFIPVIPILILLFGIIAITMFFVSSQWKYTFIGIGLLVVFITMLGKMMQSNVTKPKVAILGIILVASLIFIFGAGYIQSVLSVSSVNVGADGKVYWVFYASANKAGETFSFNSLPGKYTLPDSSTVTPKTTMNILFTPQTPECIYPVTQVTKTLPFYYALLGASKVTYYTLGNPEKKVMIQINDGRSGNWYMDGTVVDSITIPDTDGKGKLIVETQGLLAGKLSCPERSNVAIIVNKDSSLSYKYKNELDSCINNPTITCLNNLGTNNEFTSQFMNIPVPHGTYLSGNIPLGYATFTITADQDYFNSVVYTPPVAPKPIIDSINIPSELKQSETASMIVNIKNSNTNKGLVSIKTTSDTIGITPSSTNLQLDRTASYTFNLNAGSQIKCSSIKVEVCSVEQFSTNNCDSETKNICVISSSVDKPNYCGDGICQSFETTNTCAQDCPNIPNKTIQTCSWYQTLEQINTKDYGTGYWRFFLNNPKITTTEECRTSGWIYLVLIAAIIVSILIYVIKMPSIKRR